MVFLAYKSPTIHLQASTCTAFDISFLSLTIFLCPFLDALQTYSSTYVSTSFHPLLIQELLPVSSGQTDANYHRALIWAAVLTAISHLDPDFGSVFSIQAVNELIPDASQTPGYGDCELVAFAFCTSSGFLVHTLTRSPHRPS